MIALVKAGGVSDFYSLLIIRLNISCGPLNLIFTVFLFPFNLKILVVHTQVELAK